MPSRFDALIIGAGPAGSTAASLLARAGWSVALIEKQGFPRRKVCGECIAASNLPLLDALGLGPAFEAAAGPELRQVALLRGDGAVLADLPAATHEKYRWGRALARETLDTLLLEQARLHGARVLQPCSVQTITGAPGDWQCEVRAIDSATPLRLRAALLIDAHGSWEAPPWAPTRQQRAHRANDLLAFKANFRGAQLAPGLLPVLAFDGGYGGMVLAGAGLSTVACCILRDRLDAWRRDAPGLRAGEVVEAGLGRECAGVRSALRDACRDGPWLAAGPLAPGLRLRADDALFRIGNAAGEAHPILGEGISMALQSAWLLCAQLLADAHPREARHGPLGAAWQGEVAQRYAAQWRRQFMPRLRLAAVFAQLAMRPASAAPLMALLRAWPALLTRGARWGGKTACAADQATINFLMTPWEPS